MDIIDKSFIRAPKYYILQSLLATIVAGIILFFVGGLTHAAIVAALGSSAFIVFVMPHSITAQPRRLVGGHIVGLIAGLICYYAFIGGPLGELLAGWEFVRWFGYALSVGLSIFLMAITNTEHPPAAGTALGIAAHEWTGQTIIFIILFAIGLAIVRRLLRSRMRDLV